MLMDGVRGGRECWKRMWSNVSEKKTQKTPKKHPRKLKDYELDFIKDIDSRSVREFAENNNLNPISVIDIAAQKDWVKKKRDYQKALKGTSLDKSIEKQSDKLASARDTAIELFIAVITPHKLLAEKIAGVMVGLVHAVDNGNVIEGTKALDKLKEYRMLESEMGTTHSIVERYLDKWLGMEGEITKHLGLKFENITYDELTYLKQILEAEVAEERGTNVAEVE